MKFAACAAMLAFIMTASFGFPAFAQEGLSAATKDFVYKAFIGNQFEIESSQLAVTQSMRPEVKDFAQMMIADHTKIGDTLKQTLAASKLDLLPPKSLDKEHQETLDGLKSASASMFDNLYIQAQTDAHEEAVSMFVNYAQDGDNDNLKQFAANTLPTLERHLEKIQSFKKTTVTAE